MRGKFITFEGIDGSGKSTQMELLASYLRARGADILTTREPGGTSLGRALRKTFLETEEAVAPLAELLLFAADRAQHVEFLIKPTLAAGKIVVSDRFADATAAYQGAGRGFSKATIDRVIDIATGGLKPDLTLFFDLPVEIALRRIADRAAKGGEQKNRMDEEKAEFYERARQAYLKIAETEPARFRIIDARGSSKIVHARTVKIMEKFFGETIESEKVKM
ncbi:MAG: dTMP kinase [Acidobacteria bacterium]|nr:dTMP kinase [Acidobacteriota bacterium]